MPHIKGVANQPTSTCLKPEIGIYNSYVEKRQPSSEVAVNQHKIFYKKCLKTTQFFHFKI